MSLETDVAEIKTKVEYIEKEIRTTVNDFKAHVASAQSYRDKVNAFDGVKKELDSHVIADRWFYGLVVTMLMAIIVKIFV